MNELSQIAALWGALTGTIAIGIQSLSYLRDRAQIRIDPRMTVSMAASADPIEVMPLVDFEMNVTNNGRRVAIIEEAGIQIDRRRWFSFKSRKSRVLVFSPKKEEEYIRLHEGERKKFELRRWQGSLNRIAETMGDRETAYIRLTSGKEISKRFRTATLSKYENAKRKYGAPDA